jgi:hypothetical protein
LGGYTDSLAASNSSSLTSNGIDIDACRLGRGGGSKGRRSLLTVVPRSYLEEELYEVLAVLRWRRGYQWVVLRVRRQSSNVYILSVVFLTLLSVLPCEDIAEVSVSWTTNFSDHRSTIFASQDWNIYP